MANTVISLKKSATPSATPSTLANGELAINYADGKLFYKAANGTIVEFASGSGAESSDFGTVNVGGTLLVSDVQGDILTITAGDNIVLTPDAGGDSFSISAPAVDDAFAKANTAQTTAVSAFGQANTALTTGQAAFGKANTADTNAINAFSKANTACTKADTAQTDATNAFGKANTALTTGQAAFGKANSATTIASAAFDQANSTTFTSNVVISVTDNTNAALRITQTGTGEALRVEDSTNPDATPFVVDANGDVTMGTVTIPNTKLVVSDAAPGKTLLYAASPGSNWYFDFSGSGTSYLGSNTFIIRNGKATSEYMRITSAGRLAIGRTTADYEIDVNGTVNASALLVNGSPISGGGGGAYYSGNNGDTGEATGLGDIFRVHSNTLTQNVTIYSGNNALAAGPITVDSGKVVTIQTGARMVIA